MVTIINMTAHSVTVLRNRTPLSTHGDVVRIWEPSGEVLRMDEEWVNTGIAIPPTHPESDAVHIPVLRRDVGSLRVHATDSGAIRMFDPYEYQKKHGRCLFIVSSQVLMAFPAIGTLICPAQIIREGGRPHGRILGCAAFSTNSPPHLKDVELKLALGLDF